MQQSTSKLPFLFGLVLGLAPCLHAQSYDVVDLGILPGKTTCTAEGLNESGTVVGFCSDASFQSLAYIWTQANGMQSLGTLGGATSGASDVNNLEQVVGTSVNSSGQSHLFLWTAGGGMQDLGTPLGGANDFSSGRGINNHGVISGFATFTGGNFGFRYDSGVWTNLGVLPGGIYSNARKISDTGAIAGQAGEPPTQFAQPVVWDANDVIFDIGTFGGGEGEAQTVNDLGEVCGWATDAANVGTAFIWDSTNGIQSLGHLVAGQFSGCQSLNNVGEAVGNARINSTQNHAFHWSASTGMQDLNNLIPTGTGWVLEFAREINDNGWIVGHGQFGGQIRGFLLIPTGCRTRLQVNGAKLGGTISFGFDADCHAGKLAVAFVSATGRSGSLPLPGGLALALERDKFTNKFLNDPNLRVTLDAQGAGTTPAVNLPNKASLIGLPVWAAGAVFDTGTGSAVEVSPTVAFSLQN